MSFGGVSRDALWVLFNQTPLITIKSRQEEVEVSELCRKRTHRPPGPGCCRPPVRPWTLRRHHLQHLEGTVALVFTSTAQPLSSLRSTTVCFFPVYQFPFQFSYLSYPCVVFLLNGGNQCESIHRFVVVMSAISKKKDTRKFDTT